MIAATQSNHPITGSSLAATKTNVVAEAIGVIQKARMRVTRRRVAIIEALLRAAGPVSIERIHQALGVSFCDLVTVYRCLTAFERIGIVRRSYLHQGTCLYELIVSGNQNYHIVCKACGSTDRVECYPMEGVERTLQKRGYTQISHVVEFFGICPNCQQAAPYRQKAVRDHQAVAPDRNVSPKIPSETF